MDKETGKDPALESKEEESDIKEDQFILPAIINFFILSYLANVTMYTTFW